MKSWPEFKQTGFVDRLFDNSYEKQYWYEIFERTHQSPANEISDTWDYQWLYTLWSQNGLSILPDSNLISNIGFGHPDAAHTKASTPFANLPVQDIWEIKHPKFIVRNREADAHDFQFVFGGGQTMNNTSSGKRTPLISKLRQRLKLWL